MTHYTDKELLIIKLLVNTESGETDEQDFDTLRRLLEDVEFPYGIAEVMHEYYERDLGKELQYYGE